MSRQVRCPNCGAGHTLVNPGISMLVCDHCHTTVYWDANRTARLGTQSILPEGDTRLYLYATGKILGRAFRVVGHVRYEHARGSWDEWYLEVEDGKLAWVSEDERKLSLERSLKPDEPLPQAGSLAPGQSFALSGQTFTAREIGRARCVGGEGQLPFAVLAGEEYPYVDIATEDGSAFGTLEYDEAEQGRAFLGRPLSHDQLILDEEKPPSAVADLSDRAAEVECPNCGAPLQRPTEREVETVVCAYCGAQNDLTGPAARVMGVNPKDLSPRFRFDIGQAGTFDDVRYEVCGRMLYRDLEGYETREYLLHNPDRGYLWLAEEDGHFALNRPTRRSPAVNPFDAVGLMQPKAIVEVGDKPFRFYEMAETRLAYVDGALPWLAAVDNTFRYADLVAPPAIFSVESDGEEVEYFQGTYLKPEEVWKAFDLPPPPPEPSGVHPAQPFHRGPLARLLMLLGGLFALLNLALWAWSFLSPGEALIFSEGFSSGEYLSEGRSEPFVVGEGSVLRLSLSAPVDNAWLFLDVALVNEKDQVMAEASGEVAYYHGVEDGEHYTEGSRHTDHYFRAPPPGRYRLILKGERGGQATSQVPQRYRQLGAGAGGERVTVSLYQGAMLSRYFLALAVLLALFPAFEIARRWSFEKQRWAPVTEDDDDDDDGDWY